ncbi:MAG: T9SS type A sorting domain-containing protein [Bacteroidetes bacterium]|nr:T9SS type A sorting domain-containing protein [Bacteroidota bacterium]
MKPFYTALSFLILSILTSRTFAQTATQLAITTQPVLGNNGGSLSVQPVVEIRDAGNAKVTNSTAQVQIVIASGTGGTLGGTTTINAVNGVATFTNLTFTGTAGQNYTFQFKSEPVLASEPFAYTAGSTLTGQTGGFGWSGAWLFPNAANGNFDPMTIGTNLSYTGFSTSGGSAAYISFNNGADGGRVLAAASNAAYNVVWLSFLGSYDREGGGFNSFRLLTNATSAVNGGIGGNNNYANWTILDNNLQATTFSSAPMDGTTRLALLKIDYTAGTSSLWMDPTIATFDGTQTPSVTASFAPVFDRIDFYNRYDNVATDEITLTSTYKAALHLESNLTPATSAITVLPVSWTSFTATCKTNQTLLQWSTASEFNNNRYIVQKSTDAATWQSIGKVKGAGNSSLSQSYQFIDSIPSAKSYYRLEQVDIDGNSRFSTIISSNCNITTLKIFPNPTHDVLYFNGAQPGLPYQLIDATGKVRRTGLSQAGTNTIPLTSLPAGNYFLKVKGNEVQTIQLR